jgi:serine/threonine protein kinase
MANKKIFIKGQKFNDWILDSYLGGGGNGEVWSCFNSSGEKNAIKLLKKVKAKSYSRFIDEATVVSANSDIIGIIPILDKYLPANLNEGIPFYVMPLAQTIENLLRNTSIEQKVKAVIQVAESLCELHNRKIFHRDIKPDNILLYNERFSLADFGLVDYPDKKDISSNNEPIGPKWTMAPEMKRESSNADASKADVYSLAKTLWIILTDRTKGFDGQYSIESIIDLKIYYASSYTSPIDNLLISSTDNDPTKRPTITVFLEKLREWEVLNANFHEQKLHQWLVVQSKLFPALVPQRVTWSDKDDIVKILKMVCSFDQLNHFFYPNGGGMDLKDVRLSHEDECIELDCGLIDIVKPSRLIFESFNYNPEWNYFRLEIDNLKPIEVLNSEGIKTNVNIYDHEVVSELSEGEYYSYKILENREYYKKHYLITSYSRHVSRWFRGSFVFFCKTSIYNSIASTYDGRHNKMNTDEFRLYIQNIVDELKKREIAIDASLDNYSGSGLNKKKVKHYLERDIVYVCTDCGDVIDFDGTKLDSHSRMYNIKVIEKFGKSVKKEIKGLCCKN